jgi:hypothetical protein
MVAGVEGAARAAGVTAWLPPAGRSCGPAAPLQDVARFSRQSLQELTPSLSEIDGEALCYQAFPQAARLRQYRRDGVHRRPAAAPKPEPS